MARPQETTSPTSSYPRRQRATPAPSYSDITRSPSPASDNPDAEIETTTCPQNTGRSRYPRRATYVPSYLDLTYISRTQSPKLDALDIEEVDYSLHERSAILSSTPAQTRSKYSRRSTPAPSYSDITELSRSPSAPSGSDMMEIYDEITSETWSATSNNSESFFGAQSPTPSDASDNFIIVRPASPPPGFCHMSQASLCVTRRASHASTEMSALTWLSHTPSLPSERRLTPGELAQAMFEIVDVSEENVLEEEESEEGELEEATIEEVVERFRDANGRTMARRPRTQTLAIDDDRPVKKIKTTATSGRTKIAVSPFSRSATTVSSPPPTANDGSSGTLATLPLEIRQQIFAYAVDTTRSVINKQCCGPVSTKRERDSCRKHGNKVALDTGRFNLLLVSKKVAEEASWVLYNRGSLKLELGKTLRPYYSQYRSKSSYRLGEIPHAVKIKAMWMSAARYRFVELALSSKIMRLENPEDYTNHLCETASLLLKAWEKELYQPTAEVPHKVTISLGALFDEVVPFNANPDLDMDDDIHLWSLINFPGQQPDFGRIAANSGKNFMRLISIVRQNCGLSEWKMVALSEIDEESEGYKWLKGVRKEC